ncbi:hypothetical protein CC80DRAFT_543344 [Byssothecium circinans]|uniref:Uncharacterized protein n=1 Tax=Byssothecium circinans TaxID=147558 RepID=A0A6A5UAN9_9PLEO|nr:hypothetical protein CC80DRAFT_543344 [Byssothecium circinans]
MGNWFGNLDLAYKYTIVFVSLLVLTLTAGLIKVLFDRRKMKKLIAKQNEEAGPREEQMELNQREKDEGDLFGVRAIEAGFYAGIPQSRPTSRAGSPAGSPSMSSTTLLSGYNSPKIQTNSMASSITDLPLAHTNRDSNRDSQALPSTSPQRRTPSALRLAPSVAEISGRHNHNVDVNMNLNVPPSPVLTKSPRSPTFAGFDDENETRPAHYAPVAPQLPMPQGFEGSLMSGASPENNASSSLQPHTMKPSMPSENSKSPYVAYNRGPQSNKNMSNLTISKVPSIEPVQPVLILPATTYEPSHKRDESDASSVYSDKRNSTYQFPAPAFASTSASHQRTTSTGSYNYSFPGSSDRNSVALGVASKEGGRRQSSANSSLLAPGSTHSKDSNDPRFSDFYDAYYRNSHLVKDAPRRPDPINTEPTIVEVPTPLASPAPRGNNQPGMAL